MTLGATRWAGPAVVFLLTLGFAGPELHEAERPGDRRVGVAAAAVQLPSRPPDVPFVPTPPDLVTAMLELARVGPGDVVFDLGSGDGRILIAAAQRFGTRGVGIEIDPIRIREARERARAGGVDYLITFLEQDFFEADLSQATVVTLYLLPRINWRLRPKLLRELRPGTRVVSHTYDMSDWTPTQTTYAAGKPVYLWVIPPQER